MPSQTAAAMKREAHVRTAVVDRVHLLVFGEQAEHVATDVDDEAAGSAQFAKRSGAEEAFGCHSGHDFLLCQGIEDPRVRPLRAHGRESSVRPLCAA